MTFGAGKGEPGTVFMVTFGTGIGSALFVDGVLVPNTEFGHLEIRGKDAEERASERAKSAHDMNWKQWAKNVNEYLEHIEALVYPQLIIVGGGISKQSEKFLPLLTGLHARVVPAAMYNDAGITGAAMAAHPGSAAPVRRRGRHREPEPGRRGRARPAPPATRDCRVPQPGAPRIASNFNGFQAGLAGRCPSLGSSTGGSADGAAGRAERFLDLGDAQLPEVEHAGREHRVGAGVDGRGEVGDARPRRRWRSPARSPRRGPRAISSRSKPASVPSASIELSRISPAPSSAPRRAQSTASMPVPRAAAVRGDLEPARRRLRRGPGAGRGWKRRASTDSTTHCEPNRRAASASRSGRAMAAVFSDTLSAPARSSRSTSSSLRTPPPTVSGMNTCSAVRRTTS